MKKGICPNHEHHEHYYTLAKSKKVQSCDVENGQAFNCRYCLSPLVPYTKKESLFSKIICFFKELNPIIYRQSGLGFATFFLLISFLGIWLKFYPNVTVPQPTTNVTVPEAATNGTVTQAATKAEVATNGTVTQPTTKGTVPEAAVPKLAPEPNSPPKSKPQDAQPKKNRPQEYTAGLGNRVRPQTSAEPIIRRTTLTPYITQGGQKMELNIAGLKNRGAIDENANSQISVNFGLSKDAFPSSDDKIAFTLKNAKGSIVYGPKQIAVKDGIETVIIPAGIIPSNNNELYTATLYYQQEELGHCEFRTPR